MFLYCYRLCVKDRNILTGTFEINKIILTVSYLDVINSLIAVLNVEQGLAYSKNNKLNCSEKL